MCASGYVPAIEKLGDISRFLHPRAVFAHRGSCRCHGEILSASFTRYFEKGTKGQGSYMPRDRNCLGICSPKLFLCAETNNTHLLGCCIQSLDVWRISRRDFPSSAAVLCGSKGSDYPAVPYRRRIGTWRNKS